MSNVSFVRKDLKNVLNQYKLIQDCIDGEETVKSKRITYLPIPNSADDSEENLFRYAAYLRRALFYNVTARTLNGFLGEIFSKEPEIKIPKILDDIKDNVNGSGINLIQSCKKAVSSVLAFGRGGLFVDYPNTNGAVTKKELKEGNIRPTINFYKPVNIINWNTKQRGGETILSLVVLKEIYTEIVDEFEIKEKVQYRVLRLGKTSSNKTENLIDDEDIYTIEVWRNNEAVYSIVESYQPKDFNGNSLNEICFHFLGSENNDSEIDNPPLYDLASLNIAHYRNSADYEESCFIIGQPTPYFTGLTEDWVKNVLNGTVTLGARASIPLPTGSTAGLLQAEPNTMAFEAMQHKEKQMTALGAKLIEQKSIQRTATEAKMDDSSEKSILASVAKNVSYGYEWALKKCTLFIPTSENEIVFKLNTEFNISNMSAEERRQVIEEWQAGAISFSEMRENLKKADIAKLDDEEALKEINKNKGMLNVEN